MRHALCDGRAERRGRGERAHMGRQGQGHGHEEGGGSPLAPLPQEGCFFSSRQHAPALVAPRRRG
eukprot:2655629-Pyramimonas_sp.AAC.1